MIPKPRTAAEVREAASQTGSRKRGPVRGMKRRVEAKAAGRERRAGDGARGRG